MQINQNLLDILKERKITQKQLANEINVIPATVNTWFKMDRSIPAEKIIEICEFLDVSPAYLLTGKEDYSSLSDNEKELLSYFKQLPEREQVKLIGRAEQLAESYAAPPIEIVTIKHSIHKVSAGLGYDLNDGDAWDDINVVKNSISKKADFTVSVEGDSMEPDFSEGDVVLVKQQDAVDEGDICIFIVDKEGYIKKFGGDRLISLNEKYDDILFSEHENDIKMCCGLVLGKAEVVK